MNKKELTRVLKPLIKDCIKEVIFEEGVLSGLINEVVTGLESRRVVTEGVTITSKKGPDPEELRRREEEYEKNRQEKIRRLNESMKVNGVDVFEGTKQILDSPSGPSPMSGVRPGDAGVNLESLIGAASKKWKHLI